MAPPPSDDKLATLLARYPAADEPSKKVANGLDSCTRFFAPLTTERVERRSPLPELLGLLAAILAYVTYWMLNTRAK